MRKALKKKTTVVKQPKIKENGKCYDCVNAFLMQAKPLDPIVCLCQINQERHVAKYNHCQIKQFEKNKNDERKINSMIFLK